MKRTPGSQVVLGLLLPKLAGFKVHAAEQADKTSIGQPF